MSNLIIRPRRLRKSETIRSLIQETKLSVQNLIFPLFVKEGLKDSEEIEYLPGLHYHGTNSILKEIEECMKLGLRSFALFPVLSKMQKDNHASEALNPDGLIPRVIAHIKKTFPDCCLISDLALDPFTEHGHDGIVDPESKIVLNDETVEILSQMAVIHAEAGSDIVAPSDMMDGRVASIRKSLDQAGKTDTLILSYSVKYCSSFYGPFRDTLSSKLAFGDKKTYQMDFANVQEALKEIELDIAEGADMIMIKPALSYLDVIHRASQDSKLPLVAFSVSGEYAMIKAACLQNIFNEQDIVIETHTAILRAGARAVITYFAKDCAKLLKEMQN